MFGGWWFPSAFACAWWCSLQCTPVGVKVNRMQSDFILAWLRVFLMQEEQNACGMESTCFLLLLPICEGVFFEVSRWSPLWVTIHHLQVKPFFLQVLWYYLSQDPNQLCSLCLFLPCFQFTEFVPGVLFALVWVCVARKEIKWSWGKKKTCYWKLEEGNSQRTSPGTVICFLWGMYANKSFPFACINESD